MSLTAAVAVGVLDAGRGKTCARLKCLWRSDSFIKTFARFAICLQVDNKQNIAMMLLVMRQLLLVSVNCRQCMTKQSYEKAKRK